MKSLLLSLILSISCFAFDAAKEFKNNCATCHTIGGGVKKGTPSAGPDLAGVSKRRSIEWIVKFVKYPDGMIDGDADEEGYEKADELAKKVFAAYKPARMTEQELETAQIKAIVKYIDSQKKEPKGKIVDKSGKVVTKK